MSYKDRSFALVWRTPECSFRVGIETLRKYLGLSAVQMAALARTGWLPTFWPQHTFELRGVLGSDLGRVLYKNATIGIRLTDGDASVDVVGRTDEELRSLADAAFALYRKE